MMTLNDLPRLPDIGWLGSFGVTTPERLAFQRDLAVRKEAVVRGRVLHLPLVLPCSPEAAHEVLVTKAKSFEKSPGIRVLLHTLAGAGLFTSEGTLWRRQRKLMSPIFQPAPMHQYAETMRLVAERAADGMHEGQHLDIAHETTRIAMLLRRWRLEVDPARTIGEDDFATLRPKGGVPAVLRARTGHP